MNYNLNCLRATNIFASQNAPQNAPQIASCAVVSRRLASSLFLVQVVCRRVASSGEIRINTFTRLRSRVRVPQRPLVDISTTLPQIKGEVTHQLVGPAMWAGPSLPRTSVVLRRVSNGMNVARGVSAIPCSKFASLVIRAIWGVLSRDGLWPIGIVF